MSPGAMTVAEVLELSAFHDVRVVAGAAGLDRLISTASVMEVPDVADWVRPGELLMTTGYPIKDDPRAQSNLIPDLVARKVGALAVKPHRFLPDIPSAMLELAEAHAFPLLDLPDDTRFSQLLTALLGELAHREAETMSRLRTNMDRLMATLKSGRGLSGVLMALSEVTGHQAGLYDAGGALVMSAQGEQAASVTALPESLTALAGVKEIHISGANRQLFAAAYHGSRPRQAWISLEVGRRGVARLALFAGDRPLQHVDLLTLEWCSTVAELEMANRQAILSVERRYSSQFLQDWLRGQLRSAQEIRDRAQVLGWQLADGYAALLVAPRLEPGAAGGDAARVADALLAILERRFADPAGNLVGGFQGGVAVLCPHQDATALAEKVASAIYQEGRVAVRIGIGRYCGRLEEVPQSVTQARMAVDAAEAAGLEDRVVAYDSLGALRLLSLVARRPEASDFVEETIRPLVEYDRVNGTELVRTLEAFFRCNGNARAVSAELFTHYHTVLYRLERIKGITGKNLDDHEQRLELAVALKLLSVMRVEREEDRRA